MSASTSTSAAAGRPAAASQRGSRELRPDASTTKSAATSSCPLTVTPGRRESVAQCLAAATQDATCRVITAGCTVCRPLIVCTAAASKRSGWICAYDASRSKRAIAPPCH